MAGVPAGLPAGVRVSDHISLGVIAKTFPPDRVQQVLTETGKASERERDLPAQVMVYYAIAMALYMGSSTSSLPSFSNSTEHFVEDGLCCQHLGELLDQGP